LHRPAGRGSLGDTPKPAATDRHAPPPFAAPVTRPPYHE